MKNINYKMKYLNRVLYSSKGIFLRPSIIQNNSCVYKKNVKHDKNQIKLLFFVKNRCQVSKVIRHFLNRFREINPF